MKKFLLLLVCIFYFFGVGGCFIFKNKDKHGCPANGRNIGAEKLAQGDEQSMKASKKLKYRGGNKSY